MDVARLQLPGPLPRRKRRRKVAVDADEVQVVDPLRAGDSCGRAGQDRTRGATRLRQDARNRQPRAPGGKTAGPSGLKAVEMRPPYTARTEASCTAHRSGQT